MPLIKAITFFENGPLYAVFYDESTIEQGISRMNVDILSMADIAVSNGILIWLGLRLVKRVDDLNKRLDDHETRISLNEGGAQHGR